MTLRKLRINKNQEGFTLIELMIVIAIIGILAAIAIPNFIAYRDKAFCSAAESDGNSLASALADYFSIPSNVSFSDDTGQTGEIAFPGSETITQSGLNTATIIDDNGTYVITVYDNGERCPDNYMTSQGIQNGEGWKTADHYFQKTM
jgi:type IV pilus assembly protein PilA